MQVVSEVLSLHVLKNYDLFVAGINEIAALEQTLQVSAQQSSTAQAPQLLIPGQPKILQIVSWRCHHLEFSLGHVE